MVNTADKKARIDLQPHKTDLYYDFDEEILNLFI